MREVMKAGMTPSKLFSIAGRAGCHPDTVVRVLLGEGLTGTRARVLKAAAELGISIPALDDNSVLPRAT